MGDIHRCAQIHFDLTNRLEKNTVENFVPDDVTLRLIAGFVCIATISCNEKASIALLINYIDRVNSRDT